MSRDESLALLSATVDWATSEFLKLEHQHRYYRHIGWSYMEQRAEAQMLELQGRWMSALRDMNKLMESR